MEDKLQYLPASNSPCAELGCCTPYVFTFAAVRADISFDLQETAPEMTPLKSKEKKLCLSAVDTITSLQHAPLYRDVERMERH
ncbi:uncharacterized protein LOC143764254 isoform X2 [Ranitomeya variabilis]|uniref:uncharacterized protein LOC143764254 isoform X2 n=1 Tax=Ranitomeya variabilis TaxID=490064 RepID=UPI00405658F7